jgi:micrococcal nuclease
MTEIGFVITFLTCLVVPANMYTQWQISKGNLRLGYPLLMFVYCLYIAIETILALRDPEQISILLFDVVNVWAFFMAFKGYVRLKNLDKLELSAKELNMNDTIKVSEPITTEETKDSNMYEYKAELVRLVDADTMELSLDLGFNIKNSVRVQLFGVDAPDLYGSKSDPIKFARATEARDFVAKWFTDLGVEQFLVKTHKQNKTDKYGRWLAEIWTMDKTKCLNGDLIEAGFAVKD